MSLVKAEESIRPRPSGMEQRGTLTYLWSRSTGTPPFQGPGEQRILGEAVIELVVLSPQAPAPEPYQALQQVVLGPERSTNQLSWVLLGGQGSR